MKTVKFPVTVTEQGVTAKIRKITKQKNGCNYTSYVVEYFLLGKRKQVWRSDFTEAKTTATDACLKIANGSQSSMELKDKERLAYARAIEFLEPVHTPIDTACHEYADATQILSGKASIVEACRDWAKHNAVVLSKIAVAAATEQLKNQARIDRKSNLRQKQLAGVLDRFAKSFNVEVQAITPSQISTYLAGLPMAERSKRNHRDVIGFFNRWLNLRGYLPKGTDWLEGVQNYTARKLGEIQIYTPEELRLLLSNADTRLMPFLAIGAFAGLRHAEIARLDWSEIELAHETGESFIEVRADKAKTQTRNTHPQTGRGSQRRLDTKWLCVSRTDYGSFVTLSTSLDKVSGFCFLFAISAMQSGHVGDLLSIRSSGVRKPHRVSVVFIRHFSAIIPAVHE
jgi:integrase